MQCKFKDLQYIQLTSELWEDARNGYTIKDGLNIEATSRLHNYYATPTNIEVRHIDKLFSIMQDCYYVTEAKVGDYLVWNNNLYFIDVYSEQEFKDTFEELSNV